MSESESNHGTDLVEASDTQLFSAEYKDGQLQIVEVTPFEKGDSQELVAGTSDLQALDGDSSKYVQVVNADKSMMQLDLLNLTLVRCEDGGESYRLVSNSEAGDSSSEATVTCVLHSSDNEETDGGSAYVMVEGDQGPLVFLQSAPAPVRTEEPKQPPKMSPAEILEKAKALQKAKQQIMASQPTSNKSKRGRKRKSDLPPPHELLSSPNFKLFLYSCKLCTFKCNAIKEMTAHKASAHSSSAAGSKWRRGHGSTLQCAVCPYRGTQHSQLMKHVQDMHEQYTSSGSKVSLEGAEAADVLVCGACGFECAARALFREHIERVHRAQAC